MGNGHASGIWHETRRNMRSLITSTLDSIESLRLQLQRPRYGHANAQAHDLESSASPSATKKRQVLLFASLIMLLIGATSLMEEPYSSGESENQQSSIPSAAPLEHRRGVRCAADAAPGNLVALGPEPTCLTRQQMATNTLASGGCFFTVPEPITPHIEGCVASMQVCSSPLRLTAAAGYVIYSACTDEHHAAALQTGKITHSHDSGTSHASQARAAPVHTSQVHATRASPPVHFSSLPPPSPPPPMVIAAPTPTAAVPSRFVRVAPGGRMFERDGRPFHFVGTTMWYGAYLGVAGPSGNRARLQRELDELASLGIRQVRVLASGEGPADIPYHVVPSFQPNPSEYSRDVLEGLDFFLKELARRDMVAVLILNNGEPWSGGMAQYVAWATHTRSPYSMQNTDWDAFHRYVNHFFKLDEAKLMANTYARTLLGRRNSYTGLMYRDDPAIMAWEMAHAPRGGPTVNQEYQMWIRRTSALFKSLAPNHLVALGSEGTGGAAPFRAEFDVAEIDYTVVHIWPEKYRWYDPSETNAGNNLHNAISRAKDFMDSHVRWSEQMNKPLVVESFTLSRDMAALDPTGPTAQRDAFFAAVLKEADDQMRAGRGLGGVSFWGWAGEGHAVTRKQDGRDNRAWRTGDPFLGDPPSEQQGKFSVYASDSGTCNIIKRFADKIKHAADKLSAA